MTSPPGSTLEDVLRAGEAAFPELAPDRAALRAQLGQQLDPTAPPTSEALQVDLYLAAACAIGHEPAFEALEQRHFPAVTRSLMRGRLPLSLDELVQLLRERLFLTRPGQTPKISSFRARGPLEKWLRAVALRLAGGSQSGAPAPRGEEWLVDQPMLAPDAELDLLRARHRGQFQRALQEAFAALTVRERAVLRLHFVSGLPVEQVAAHYHVAKSSASRWLSAARAKICEHVRARLGAELSLTRAEQLSLISAVRSQLSISLLPLLRSTPT